MGVLLLIWSCAPQEQPPAPAAPAIPEPAEEIIDVAASSRLGMPSDTTPFLDFEFDKAIAFSTRMDWSDPPFTHGSPYDWSQLKDTISHTLTKRELKQLDKVLRGEMNDPKRPDSEGADCFNPRHFIVFFDVQKQLLHHASVCFECGTMMASRNHQASFAAMEDFFTSLGLRVFMERNDHRDFCDSVLKSRKK